MTLMTTALTESEILKADVLGREKGVNPSIVILTNGKVVLRREECQEHKSTED